jgi:iron(III) transport system permease protein
MKRVRWQEPVVFLTVLTALLAFSLLPLLVLAAEVLTGFPREALGLLGSTELWGLLWRTVARAGIVTVIDVLIGVPLGFLFARTDALGRGAAFLLHSFPMFLPPFLLALGWFHLIGRQALFGAELTGNFLFSAYGLIFVLALTFAPIVTSLTALALHAVDPSLEEAGRVVASRKRVAFRILLPIAWPSITLAALIVFALSVSELGVPMFLRVDAYPAAVFARLGGITYNPGEALILALPLLMVALVLLGLERIVIGRRPFTVLGLRRPHESIPLGRWRLAGTVVIWTVSIAGILPIAGLVIRAVRGSGFAALKGWLGSSIQNSFVTSVAAATIITIIGVVLGRVLAHRQRWSSLIDGISVLAFVTPAAVLGTGLIALWNRPTTTALYASSAILVLGYVGRFLVVGVRPMALAMAQSSPHLEEAAAVVGAPFLRRLLRIVLPMHWRAVVATWLLALVICMRDIEMAVLYYPPGKETLPIRIFTLEANGPEAVVAALSFLHVMITATVLILGFALVRRARV